MELLLLLACMPVGWALYNAYCLLLNYRRASSLHLPVICVLVSPENPIWIALQTGASFVFRRLPFEAFPVTRYSRLGWEFHDRYKTYERVGELWVLVTPNRNWLYVAQAEAAYEIFTRGRDFGRPVWMLGKFRINN